MSNRPILSAQDLLAGSGVIHEIEIPPQVLTPDTDTANTESNAEPAVVRLRPLNVATMTLIARAAREDASLVPLLMIKESLVEPAMTLDQIKRLHVGLVHFLVSRINRVSGLSADGQALDEAANSPLGQMHVLLAKHFGWTPEQVSQLTPGQVAVYLAGVEKLLQLEKTGT
jgi:hypothetical protein